MSIDIMRNSCLRLIQGAVTVHFNFVFWYIPMSNFLHAITYIVLLLYLFSGLFLCYFFEYFVFLLNQEKILLLLLLLLSYYFYCYCYWYYYYMVSFISETVKQDCILHKLCEKFGEKYRKKGNAAHYFLLLKATVYWRGMKHQSRIKVIRGPPVMKLGPPPFNKFFQKSYGFKMSSTMYDVIICSN